LDFFVKDGFALDEEGIFFIFFFLEETFNLNACFFNFLNNLLSKNDRGFRCIPCSFTFLKNIK
ncbi:MAG: hypothetical protein B6D55_00245, partial [Candidatus Omnitrophica bacterium 4484_70.2]